MRSLTTRRMKSDTAPKRVGLMGGTFDPIHNAHLALAECAMQELSLHEVWFMPAGDPYFKHDRCVSAASDRASMTELAIRPYPGFRLSRIELERHGETYTSETLAELKKRYPEVHFYFILGSDSLYQLETWHDPETIMRLATLVAAEREYPDRPRSFSMQLEYLRTRYGADIAVLHFPETDLSSTEIRHLASENADLSSLVPKAVSDYIRKHQLYHADVPTSDASAEEVRD